MGWIETERATKQPKKRFRDSLAKAIDREFEYDDVEIEKQNTNDRSDKSDNDNDNDVDTDGDNDNDNDNDHLQTKGVTPMPSE